MTPYSLLLMLVILYTVRGQDKRCVTYENKAGVCMVIHNCQSARKKLQEVPLTQKTIDSLRKLSCGYSGSDPKVCCALPESTNPDPPDVSNHRNIRLLNHDLCGPVTQQKIYGGQKTTVLEYPWMALVGFIGFWGDLQFVCGGSLINDRYVLTAAHCNKKGLHRVRIGEHNTKTVRDCDREANGEEIFCADKYQEFDIAQLHIHPDFKERQSKNDIALIRLNGIANFQSQNVRPICLPIGTASILKHNKATLTGWGLINNDTKSDELLQSSITIVSNEECARAYTSSRSVWYKHMCAGGNKIGDSCSGDSGGPLQAPAAYNDKVKFVQYGIVSFGRERCPPVINFPIVFTRVAYYLDWILDNMKP